MDLALVSFNLTTTYKCAVCIHFRQQWKIGRPYHLISLWAILNNKVFIHICLSLRTYGIHGICTSGADLAFC